MIFLLMIPLYLILNIYILARTIKWLHLFTHKRKLFTILYIVLYVFLSSSFFTAAFWPAGTIQRYLKLLNNYWYGTFIYILLLIFTADLIKIIGRKFSLFQKNSGNYALFFKATGILIALSVVAVSLYGIQHAKKIQTTSYEVICHKDSGSLSELNVVLVADFHLGYSVGIRQMTDMVEKINAQNPDIICIAGDIFDNEYDALDDPEGIISVLSTLKSKYGVYACYGNHDIEERLLGGFTMNPHAPKLRNDKMEDFLARANITTLCDETVLVDDSFYLIGRVDPKKPGAEDVIPASISTLTANLDQTKPILLMEHEPEELQEAADSGVDLELGGHTHDGQMFPGNLTIKLLWQNAYGCLHLDKGDMYSIVTSGVGVYGPAMRIGTKSEIVKIHISFAAASRS